MDKYADADEGFADADPLVDWDRLNEVAAIITLETPRDALRALYGDDLIVPA